MSAWTRRVFNGKAAQEIVPPRPRILWWKGPGADSEEKHEPASDIDTALMDSLKVLDPEGPIREADIAIWDPKKKLTLTHAKCSSTSPRGTG
jgi:hypothetical protein